MGNPFIFQIVFFEEKQLCSLLSNIHYTNCDVIRGQNKEFKLKYLISKTSERKNIRERVLLYEYRNLFIDMAVRNIRSELAIANRYQER